MNGMEAEKQQQHRPQQLYYYEHWLRKNRPMPEIAFVLIVYRMIILPGEWTREKRREQEDEVELNCVQLNTASVRYKALG